MIQKDAHAFSPSLNMRNTTNKILYELRTRPAAQTLATAKGSMSTPGDTPNIWTMTRHELVCGSVRIIWKAHLHTETFRTVSQSINSNKVHYLDQICEMILIYEYPWYDYEYPWIYLY